MICQLINLFTQFNTTNENNNKTAWKTHGPWYIPTAALVCADNMQNSSVYLQCAYFFFDLALLLYNELILIHFKIIDACFHCSTRLLFDFSYSGTSSVYKYSLEIFSDTFFAAEDFVNAFNFNMNRTNGAKNE